MWDLMRNLFAVACIFLLAIVGLSTQNLHPDNSSALRAAGNQSDDSAWG